MTTRTDGVVLLGLMGAGKSTVGRALAAATELPFVDLDARIADEAGKDIPTIFAEEGEAAFREMEAGALKRVARERPLVLAVGGGTPVRASNWPVMEEIGRCVWLDVDPETAARRADDGSRPLLYEADPEAKLRALLAARREAYARAELRVDAGRPVDEVVDRILRALDESRGHAEGGS